MEYLKKNHLVILVIAFLVIPYIFNSIEGGSLGARATSTITDSWEFEQVVDLQAATEISSTLHVTGEIKADTRASFASTSPWAAYSFEAEASLLSTSTPIFVIGDQGTATPMFMIDANGDVAFGTTTDRTLFNDFFNVGGDAAFSSSGTTTIRVESTGSDAGFCFQLQGSDDVLYRLYIVATTTGGDGNTGAWQIESGACK